MKTRYKIIIIMGLLCIIPISIIFPDVFLIFHLDKYEISEKCNSVNGTWNWYYDTCYLGYDKKGDPLQCNEVGAIKKCNTCLADLEYYPWGFLVPWGCIDICHVVCQWADIPLVNKS